jgi:zinc D-Ala-D-Ala carboxypeptidase
LTSRTSVSKNSSKKAPSPIVEDKSPKLKEEGDYYVWEKGQVFKLSDHFSTKEMDCRCKYESCKDQRISKDLINRLEKVRTEVGSPLIITSAYRCTEYQAHLRSAGVNTVVAKKSTHELGDAVDAIPKKGMEGFEDICAKHFDSIGLANNFLHLDTRQGKRRWKY